jgi:hypothetical protein
MRRTIPKKLDANEYYKMGRLPKAAPIGTAFAILTFSSV